MDESRIEALLDDMTLEEQVSILSGENFWEVAEVARLEVGRLRVTDGPNGARGGGSLIGGVKSAAFPVGIALGATWSPELVREIGAALAGEAKAKSAHVLLAPTVNLHRSVTNGRNFECYSEDPVLTAELGVAYVEGLQGGGVGATMKHFVANDSEVERTTMSSDVEERVLREMYLVPFEAAVKRAKTWGIMSSYNKLNGTYTAENRWLLTQVLREEWGFEGMVVSDWFGSRSCAPTVNAGLDLEMPGPTRDRGEKLISAVKAGEVSAETVRARARAVLSMMLQTRAVDDHAPKNERAEDRPEVRALIRRAGAEASVLLKNEGVLPLAGKGPLAVIGPNAKVAQIMGGGSAQLNPHYAVSPWEGLAAALGAEALRFAPGCTNHRFEPLLKGDFRVEFFRGRALQGEAVYTAPMEEVQAFWVPPFADGKVAPGDFSARITGTFVPEASGVHRVGVFSAGLSRVFVDGELVADAWEGWTKGRTFFEEGCDEVVGEVELEAGRAHEVVVEFASRASENLTLSALHVGIGRPMGDDEIAEAAKLAAGAEVALVFVGRSGEWDTEGSDLESIALPGRQDDLVRAVAAANPRTVVVLQTGGPVEMPWLLEVPAVLQAWYPGQEAGNAIADVLLGHVEPGGRLPQTFPSRWEDNPTWSDDPSIYPGQDGHVRYAEGLYTGYRHYDRAGIRPTFAFGHGLGYTRFALSGATAAGPDGGGAVSVTLSVENIGTREGSCVVQAYVSPKAAPVDRPEKELKGFAKLALEAGEQREVTIRLPARSFAYWDTDAGGWHVAAGAYEIRLGTASDDLPLSVEVEQARRLLEV